ncbi:hypothetical protein KR018_003805 [Drosophila ironensis]|nr:hypothetical protein KR018_003805 [Drosophila ironensis]
MHFVANEYSNQNSITIDLISGKNCSTSSSTDSGVTLHDNDTAEFRPGKGSSDKADSEQKANPVSDAKRISIEHTVNISQGAQKSKKKSSPTVSIRSATISIVSIDENAIDSSCIDSDSEADAEDYTIQKLGHQVSYPPNSSHLRDLNQGLTVIARQVAPGQSTEAPEAGASAVAKQILNGNLALATPTSPPQAVAGGGPQGIGSIALTNSTDVTFGDKHFYEGPVTIQQFLIDNRDKWKSGDGTDNPGFNGNPSANVNATGSKLDDSTQAPPLCPFLPNTVGRKAVAITVAFVLLATMLVIVLATTTNLFGKTVNQSKLGDVDDSRQNIPINSTIANFDVVDNGTLVMVKVADWGGKPAKQQLGEQKLPVHRVVISHTAAEGCESTEVCSARVRVVQSFHMDSWGWDHIGYNFLVGGDGRIYEGRGWDYVGAHTKGYNVDSIGVSFIGTFTKTKPNKRQLKACELLIAEGVRLKKLAPDYRLYGHRQLSATESPGEEVYKIIKTWPHWSHEI